MRAHTRRKHKFNYDTGELVAKAVEKMECKICGKCCVGTGALRDHIRRNHETKKDCVCEICAKAFKNNRALKFHMNSHTGERPYKCDKCGAAFLRPTNLANHVVIHRNEKFTCEVCDRSFVHKRSFDRHKLLHTGDQSVSRISIVKQVLVV